MSKKISDEELSKLLTICHQSDIENDGFRLYMKIVKYKFMYRNFDMIHCAKWFFKLQVESREAFLNMPFYTYPAGVLKFNES